MKVETFLYTFILKVVILINEGKKFENSIKKSVPENCYFLRLHDPAQSFNQTDNLRFSLQNPYDILLFSYPLLFCLELKSTEGTSMTYFREDFVDKTKKQSFMIKKNQIEGLLKANKSDGIVAGFLLNWRLKNGSQHTYFWFIDDFLQCTNTLAKKSFNESDVVNNNGILIEQTKLRTNYKYNIEKFIIDMKNYKNV
ncbi:hypothetical protein KQI61_07840 [Anaerocolumna aminovalerica]|uniref:hypothetical protein n=1 Tax=Anaerocolumna aminovalerica TaxID=1527 RepID=UPI001C0ED6D3|nr:hypothetical protein [Anaerocolumna aminovalerica]MBU5332108.1 hypothetical protein [Anaerocolumna aminovalerica]